MRRRGFSSGKYVAAVVKEVALRQDKFKKLYLEVGGKLLYDGHASRVLPGYDPDTKLHLLKKLQPCDLIYCCSAKDLLSNRRLTIKKRPYQTQVAYDLATFRRQNIPITAVVVTRYSGEKSLIPFFDALERQGYPLVIHHEYSDYTKSPAAALRSYSQQSFIQTTEDLVLVTGVAGGSGKMATAMSQIAKERKMKKKVGYAKIETFPVWDLPATNPINLAYEAATADLGDKVMVDKRHKGQPAVNYNRDIENYEILQALMKKLAKEKYPFGYTSPTAMGIGVTSRGITNEVVCFHAAIKEIRRRYRHYKKEWKAGREHSATIRRMEQLMKTLKKL